MSERDVGIALRLRRVTERPIGHVADHGQQGIRVLDTCTWRQRDEGRQRTGEWARVEPEVLRTRLRSAQALEVPLPHGDLEIAEEGLVLGAAVFAGTTNGA